MGLYHYWWPWVMMIVLVVELCFYSSNSEQLTCHPGDLDALRDF
ncbi:hypothetical protein AALP_AA1G161200, partial [Arabis alpina]